MNEKIKIAGGQNPPACCHRGDAVVIGDRTLWAGGEMHLQPGDLDRFTTLVKLRDEKIPRDISFGHWEEGVLSLPIVDYQTVQNKDWGIWRQRLAEVRDLLPRGMKVIVYCAGGHGRTGLFLASLLAMVEPEIDDPVAEIRRRYCYKAVETAAQEAQVMRLLREVRATRAEVRTN